MRIRKFGIAAALLAAGGLAVAATNPVSNPGFESGDLSGWSKYITNYYGYYDLGSANATTGVYSWNWSVTPAEGSYFGVVESGLQDNYNMLWQSFNLNKKDKISGYSCFATYDYYPYNDDGATLILSGDEGGSVVSTAFADSVGTNSYHSSGWQYWEYEAPSAGEYTILSRCTNRGDSGVSSWLGLDGVAHEPGLVEVTLDIKPGSSTNPINLGSKGVIPVAILGTSDFDVDDVDVDSLAFGPGGASEAHGKGHYEDVNGDGITDLVLHFDTKASNIGSGDTSATLTGKTTDDLDLTGTDVVSIVK